MRPSEWINCLLQRHNLTKPDGRPLFQYRVTDDEFSNLSSLLKVNSNFLFNDIGINILWDAGFVIYAAEWWRRFYTGQWGWDGILDSLGINSNDLNVNKRGLIIESGLQRWRREIRLVNDKKMFLGTVATEGGLPLNQLQDSGGWLRNVLQPTLRKHLARGIDLSALIASQQNAIPQSYRSTELSEILVDISESIISIRAEYSLEDKENPVEWLDINAHNWRERFPLPIDDEQAISLLKELIGTASSIKVCGADKNQFEIERFLVDIDKFDPNLLARIEPPTFLFLDNYESQLEIDSIPSTSVLEVYEPSGKSWHWCRVIFTTYKNRKALKLMGESFNLKGKHAAKNLKLRLINLGECILDIPLLGNEYIDDNLPWLFKEIDGKWTFHGVASQSIKSSEAIAYIPSNCELDTKDIKVEAINIGNLFEGSLLKFTGTIYCNFEDTKYKLSSGSEESLTAYSLAGRSLPYQSSPREIFIGHPKILKSNTATETVTRHPLANCIAKKTGMSEKWAPLNKVGPGIYEVRMLDEEGNSLLSKRICILDETFSVKLIPDQTNNKAGTVTINGSDDFVASVHTKGVKSKKRIDSPFTHLELAVENEPVVSVDIMMMFSKQSKFALARFPFPSKGAMLFNEDNCSISFNRPLYLNNLQGHRVNIYDNNYHKGNKVTLVFSLVTTDRKSTINRDIYIKKDFSLTDDITEFSVYNWVPLISSLFGISSSVDSYVQATMTLREHKVFDLAIRPYEIEFSKTGNGEVGIDHNLMKRLDVDDLEGMKVSTLNLAQPEQNFDELTAQTTNGITTGNWNFNPEKRKQGTWLIFPAVESSLFFRPTVWNIGEFNACDKIDTLSTAILIPNMEDRKIKIRSVLRQMATDLNHKSWSYFTHLWNKTKHLPVTTLDIWRICITEPSFIASLYLKDNQGIIQWFEKELPVIWETVSIVHWLNSFTFYRSLLEEKLADTELTSELVLKKITSVEQNNISLNSVGKILKQRLLNENCPELAAFRLLPIEQLLMPEINKSFQHLLHRKANSVWPQHLSEELNRIVNELPEVYKNIITVHNDDRIVVARLPWVMAWRCVYTSNDGFLNTPLDIFKAQQIISFDEDWFSIAFRFLTGWLSQLDNEAFFNGK